MSNLFLHYCENKWNLKTKKSTVRHDRLFGKIFIFIDDLIAINDGGLFEKNCIEVHPSELELKKENKYKQKQLFLT